MAYALYFWPFQVILTNPFFFYLEIYYKYYTVGQWKKISPSIFEVFRNRRWKFIFELQTYIYQYFFNEFRWPFIHKLYSYHVFTHVFRGTFQTQHSKSLNLHKYVFILISLKIYIYFTILLYMFFYMLKLRKMILPPPSYKWSVAKNHILWILKCS